MIVSKRRLEANKRNASISTGPKTAQGKFIASVPVAAKAIQALTAILAGSRNDPWYRELARNVAESFFDLVRIRTVRSQIFYDLGEFENAGTQCSARRVREHENESIYIPIGAVHRLENPGKILLELIEVQTGSYLGEDDIIRIEDDYRRS
jgi:Mannose-6-phosphate isomerase C-terminal